MGTARKVHLTGGIANYNRGICTLFVYKLVRQFQRVGGKVVDVRREVPEPWASVMVEAGMTDPRNGRASWSALNRATGVHVTTLTAMAYGERETEQSVVEKVATALKLSPVIVSDWIGRAQSERKPYEPHSDANLLDSDERAAVNRLIVLLARSKKRGQHGSGKPAEKTDGPGGVRGRDRPLSLDRQRARRSNAPVDGIELQAATNEPIEGVQPDRGPEVDPPAPDDDNQDPEQ